MAPFCHNAILFAFKWEDFINCLNSFKSHESESNKNFIKDIPLFSQKNIDSIKAFCEICVFAKGDMILKDGDEPDHFYMIKQGRVKVEKWVKV